MEWKLIEPAYGDIIRVKAGNIWHLGIFVSEEEVIQFGKNPSSMQDLTSENVSVISTNIDDFLLNGFLEVATYSKKELTKKFNADVIVQNARNRIGEKGYHILYNNCEHFVNKCAFGDGVSAQVEKVRDFFKNMPILNVYYSQKPQTAKYDKVYPKERQKEIASCLSEKVKCDKYFVWKLLEYGLKNTFGYNIKHINITKQKNGKWVSDKCYFSLSHSDNVVAVAISNNPVGVDVEVVKEPCVQNLENKILNDIELEEYNKISSKDKTKFLIEKWTQKESSFKLSNCEVFSPKSIIVSNVVSKVVIEEEKEFYLSIASENLQQLRIIKKDL